MDVRKISASLSVAPQILPQDIEELVKQGYRSVICNRPDGESADQPTFKQIESAAITAGLQVRNIPIVGGNVSDADTKAFATALIELPGPVLAYCRTGARSVALWSLLAANAKSPPHKA